MAHYRKLIFDLLQTHGAAKTTVQEVHTKVFRYDKPGQTKRPDAQTNSAEVGHEDGD
eukprot:m.106991 g.106991  ORF g.106991 m.106991 type:complete len:57 (+) comp9203_c0_seq5:56-226(+)